MNSCQSVLEGVWPTLILIGRDMSAPGLPILPDIWCCSSLWFLGRKITQTFSVFSSHPLTARKNRQPALSPSIPDLIFSKLPSRHLFPNSSFSLAARLLLSPDPCLPTHHVELFIWWGVRAKSGTWLWVLVRSCTWEWRGSHERDGGSGQQRQIPNRVKVELIGSAGELDAHDSHRYTYSPILFPKLYCSLLTLTRTRLRYVFPLKPTRRLS